jgi:tetratricopeptide (TPR) repeat protein
MSAFRRRPFRRPLRRPPGRPLPPALRRALGRLNHAHALMAQGEFLQAAAIFEELAQGAASVAPKRAPQLHIQAGMAFLKGGQKEQALPHLRQGLLSMARLMQLPRLQATARRVLADMRSLGLAEEAAALEEELKKEIPGLDLTAPRPGQAAPPRHLPAKCPYCGGNVRSDEVEWVDEASAVCDYCGSMMEAE